MNMIITLIRKCKTAWHMSFKSACALCLQKLQTHCRSGFGFILQCTYKWPSQRNKLIIYLTPGTVLVNGGVMSIFNQAEKSRKIVEDAFVILSTYPKDAEIYAINRHFPNNEKVWRWGQVSRMILTFREVMIHVPECYAERFYDDLGSDGRGQLTKIKNLTINIMDQNIWYMPPVDKIWRLRELTPCLTQTCAHLKYATQEYADKYRLPTIWLPAYWDLDCYATYPFAKKEKRIAYSPDDHPQKEEILEMLRCEFPDFEFYEINGISFPRFMDVISRSYFTITFGEGMDGYFSQPLHQQSLSFAVYNPDFFPREYDWGRVWNVFKDYDDMKTNVAGKMKAVLSDSNCYNEKLRLVRDQLPFLKQTDSENTKDLMARLKRFYANDFEWYPSEIEYIDTGSKGVTSG